MGAEGGVCVVLGTGGTIAGLSGGPVAGGYVAAQVGVDRLVESALRPGPGVESHQVAQIDSKDMGWGVWRTLLGVVCTHLARPEVSGVVVTHGTDTLEETAALMHALLPAGKPVVLTAAMRPADAPDADGPANLRDAIALVAQARARGVSGVAVVLQGVAWAGCEVRKVHTHRLDAFSGDAPPLAVIDTGSLAWRWQRAWPRPQGAWTAALASTTGLPWVPIVTSHADADARLMDALLQTPWPAGQGPRGVVVACTGNGTVHEALWPSLSRAAERGWWVCRASRVAQGAVSRPDPSAWPASGLCTPAQARALMSVALALDRPDLFAQWLRASVSP